MPVRGFGLKNVVLGGMRRRALAHSSIWATVTGRRRKAAWPSPSRSASHRLGDAVTVHHLVGWQGRQRAWR